MIRFAQTTAEQVWPFLDFTHSLGRHINNLINNMGLPQRLLTDGSIKLSTHLVYEFIAALSHNEQLPMLGWQSGFHQGPIAFGSLSKTALKKPTLGTALNYLVKQVEQGASHANFFFKEENDHVFFCHVGGVPVKSKGYVHVESYVLAVIWSFVQLTQIQLETPVKIRMRSTEELIIPPCFELDRQGSSYSAISIPKALLEKKIYQEAIPTQPPTNRSIENLPKLEACKNRYPSLELMIEILQAYIGDPNGLPSIEHMTRICNCSKRSLQRELANIPITYTGLITDIKCETAKFYLSEGKDIHLVSRILSYKNPTHFSRAFKKNQQISPKEWVNKKTKINTKEYA
ncbi:helix-turn-helix domain-containing protein [Agaribacterium sp. ZY112]|uniref:helix-turn-helix domain-containing protein n=1 Tax=Agaribacterium sp. ZY112 TaxID=3233574 RepID=UPI00352697E4